MMPFNRIELINKLFTLPGTVDINRYKYQTAIFADTHKAQALTCEVNKNKDIHE